MADLPAHPDSALALRELAERAAAYAENDRAVSTRRTYDSALKHYLAWAGAMGAPGLPTSAAVLAGYLTEHAGKLSVPTLYHRIAAIRSAHREAGWPDPTSPDLERTWAGIRRAHGKPAEGKAALGLDELRRALAAIPRTVAGDRDRALILVGFAGALRRSELAALELEGGKGPAALAFVPEGLEVRLARSKGDQEGRGAVVAIPYGREPETCAATAVRAWLDVAAIKAGPVWRKVTRTGKVGSKPMSPQVVALVVKAAVQRVGLNPDDFAGHSLRAGLITAAAANDAPLALLADHARHSNVNVTRRYIKTAQRFSRNAARFDGL